MISSGGNFGRSVLTLSPRLFPCPYAPFVRLCTCIVDQTSASYRPKPVAFPDRCLAKFEWKHTRLQTGGPDTIQCEDLNTCCTFLYSQLCIFCGQYWFVNIPLPGYCNMQKMTQLNLMHWYESYGIAQQLMPWLHKTAGHAIVMIIHNED